MICDIICIDGFLCMSHLDIVHMLSAYVHVIHTLSGYMHIMRTLFAVVLDIFLPNRQCRCHPYVISSTLYISYHVQLSFCTLSTQMHIVHVICILFRNAYVMYMSSLLLLSVYVHVIYISIWAIYVLCAHDLKLSLISSFLTDNTNVIHTSSLVLFIYSIMYNLVSAHCLHRCTLSMSFACCPHMYTSFAFHL